MYRKVAKKIKTPCLLYYFVANRGFLSRPVGPREAPIAVILPNFHWLDEREIKRRETTTPSLPARETTNLI